MRRKSITTNAFLNVIKSVLSVIFPLITYPYAFRVLHADNIGKVDYSLSIISYFSFIAALGVTSYAIREGSKIRDNKKKITDFASEVFTINVISTAVSYILLFATILLVPKLHPYSKLLTLLSLSILFQTLSADWINIISEDFLFITVRSIITHIISLVLLFILVKNENDFYWYAFLTVLVNAVVALSNWHYCRRYIRLKIRFSETTKHHLVPITMLFANNIATLIYVNSDITMLGWIVGDFYVGIYAIAVKIYSVLKNILAAIYSVVIPRIAYSIGRREWDELRTIYSKLVCTITVLLIPVSAGVMSISKEIILLMGGEEYLEAVPTLQILSISLIGAIFGGLITYCLNIPLQRERINLIATTLSAIINVCFNIVLIPIYKQNGAAFTTAISELFVFFFCIISAKDIKKYLDLHSWKQNIIHSLFGVCTICLISNLIHKFIGYNIMSLILIVLLSIIGYFVVLLFMKNQIALEFIVYAKQRILKKWK